MKSLFVLMYCVLTLSLAAQNTSINFQLNGRPNNQSIQDSLKLTKNPFAKFIGEWTLKNDTWIQNWGYGTDTLKIEGHHTISNQINTENSLFSIIDGPEPNGHIFWSYNPKTQEVEHLSSFGNIRTGVGNGSFYGNNNLKLKVSFEGEAKGTYRVYTYEWISDNEYALNSIQYDENNQPTGLFYKGNFVRINTTKQIEDEISSILKILDNNSISKEKQVEVYTDDVVHMVPNSEVILGKTALLDYLNAQKQYGYADMSHRIIDYSSHGDIVVMRGEVAGSFYPSNSDEPVAFQTKNMFIFKRVDGDLKIAKIIYNMSPTKG